MSEKNNRRHLVLQSAVAGGVATAVLLGGFGAFSLWNDAMGTGVQDNIATGKLAITSVTAGQWTIQQTDGVLAPGSIINPTTFKASPGDVLQYTADVGLVADGSDMLAQLQVDPTSYGVAEGLSDLVDVQITNAAGTVKGAIPITASSQTQNKGVKVTVAFNPNIPEKTAQDLAAAVSLKNLSFQLTQLPGAQPAE
jgi:alternate signal-mediated exported protein